MWLLLTKGCPEYCKYEDTFELTDRITGYGASIPIIHKVEDLLLDMPIGVVWDVEGESIVRVEWSMQNT